MLQNSEMFNIVIQQLIRFGLILLMAMAMFAWRRLQAYLEARIGAEQYGHIKEMVVTVVRALEQQGILLNLTGPEKKQMATSTIIQLLDRVGYEIEPAVLDKLIEEAVQVINTEQGAFQKFEVLQATGEA
jgi:hypothetical protein